MLNVECKMQNWANMARLYVLAGGWGEFLRLHCRNVGVVVPYECVPQFSIQHLAFSIQHFPVTELPTQEPRRIDHGRNAFAPGHARRAAHPGALDNRPLP